MHLWGQSYCRFEHACPARSLLQVCWVGKIHGMYNLYTLFLTQLTGALPLVYKENRARKPNTCIVNLRKISKNPNIRSMAETANPNPTSCKSSLLNPNIELKRSRLRITHGIFALTLLCWPSPDTYGSMRLQYPNYQTMFSGRLVEPGRLGTVQDD